MELPGKSAVHLVQQHPADMYKPIHPLQQLSASTTGVSTFLSSILHCLGQQVWDVAQARHAPT
jgi:hypothetical protein